MTLIIRRMESGYWYVRGVGPCNWAQPPVWPCDDATLDASCFPEASLAFREAVRRERDALDAKATP